VYAMNDGWCQSLLRRYFILAPMLLLTLTACRKDNETARAEPLVIGADLTLTGPTAYWSEQIRAGLDAAVAEANREPNARPIRVVYQDNQANPAQAASIFQRFATVDDASVVIACFSPVARPLRDLAAQQQVPFLATVVSALHFAAPNEWTFRDFPPNDQQGTALATFAYDSLGLRKVASLVVNDDYGKDGQTAFTAEFTKRGGTMGAAETMTQTANDVRSQVIRILAGQPDGVLVIVRDNALGVAVRQLRENGFTGRILGVNAFDAPTVQRAAGTALRGTVFSSAYVDLQSTPEGAEFARAYAAGHEGTQPDWVVVYGYSIGKYLSAVLRAADGDRTRVQAALATLSVESLRGPLRMSRERDVLSPIAIYEYNADGLGRTRRYVEEVTSEP